MLVRKRFDSRSDASPIRRIVAKSVETASYTVCLGLAGAIVGVAFPQNNDQTANVPLAFTLPLPSLYALSMVVTLSSRRPREPALVTGTVHLAEIKGSTRGDDGLGSGFASGVSTPAGGGAWRAGPGGAGFGGEREKRRLATEDDLDESMDGENGRDGEGVSIGPATAFVDMQVLEGGRRQSDERSSVSGEEEKQAQHLRWA